MCGSVDSIGSRMGEPRAPEAGQFFAPQFAELACLAGGAAQAPGRALGALECACEWTGAQRENCGAGDGSACWDTCCGSGGAAVTAARAPAAWGAELTCTAVVHQAAEEARVEAAAAPSAPSAPVYSWKQAATSDGGGRVAPSVATGPQAKSGYQGLLPTTTSDGLPLSSPAQCTPSPSGNALAEASVWLALLAMIIFISWFFYPRIEPRIRTVVGAQRYEAGWEWLSNAACTAATHMATAWQTACRVATEARRAAMEAAEAAWAAIVRARAAGVAEEIAAPSRLPTAPPDEWQREAQVWEHEQTDEAGEEVGEDVAEEHNTTDVPGREVEPDSTQHAAASMASAIVANAEEHEAVASAQHEAGDLESGEVHPQQQPVDEDEIRRIAGLSGAGGDPALEEAAIKVVVAAMLETHSGVDVADGSAEA